MNLHLWKIIKEATKAVPAVKYGIGVLGLGAIVALVVSTKTDLKVAFWGTIVLIVLMIILLAFARLTQIAAAEFLMPVKLLMWFSISLFMSTCLLLFLSVFFQWPLDLHDWIKSDKKTFYAVFTLQVDKREAISREYPPVVFPAKLHLLFSDHSENVILHGDEVNNEGSRAFAIHQLHTKAAIHLDDKHWEVSLDSSDLTEGRNTITIRPNNRLSLIRGVVRSWNEQMLIGHAEIHIGTDTVLYTNEHGIFQAQLPLSMVKIKQTITVLATGYESQTIEAYPVDGHEIPFKLTPVQ